MQARQMVSGAAHMSEEFYPVPGANRERTAYVSVRRRISLLRLLFVFCVFLPAMASASKTIQENSAAAFSQGVFDRTLTYNERIYCANGWSALNGNIGPLINCRAADGGEKIILFGGQSSTSPVTRHNETYSFDAVSGSWEEIAVTTAPSSRTTFGMADDGGGKIVLSGGYDGLSELGDTWIFDTSASSWTLIECSTYPSARMGAAMARLSSDKILLFGGKQGAVSYSDTWIFNIAASSWTLINPPLSPSARANHAIANCGDGKVLLYGGESGGYLKDCWVYDFGASAWTEIDVSASNPGQRSGLAITYDSGIGRVLLFGGETQIGAEYSYNKALWMFNPSSEVWTQISVLNADPEKPEGRRQHIFCHSPGYGNILFGGGTAKTTSTDNKIFSDFKKYVISSSGTYTTKIYDTGVSVNPVEYKTFWRYFGGAGDIKYQIATSTNPANMTYTGPGGAGTYYTASPQALEPSRDGMRYLSVRIFLSCVPENVPDFYLSELDLKYNHVPETPVLYANPMKDGDSIFQAPKPTDIRAWFYWFHAVDPDDDKQYHSYEHLISTSPNFGVYISSSGISEQEGIIYSYYHPDDFYSEGKYYWKVRASDDYGVSGFSDVWTFYVDTTPPAAVTDLTAEKVLDSPGSVRLSWTATGDDGTIGNITGGEVRVQRLKWIPLTVWYAQGYKETIISTSASPGERISTVIDGLDDGTSYYFVIAYKDEVIDSNKNLANISNNNVFAWTDSPPEIISVSSPAEYAIVSGTAEIVFSSFDPDMPDGDELTYSIYLSADYMASWQTITEDLPGGTTFFYFDTLSFPNSDFCNIKVSARDRAGLTCENTSGVFIIRNPNYPPLVELTSPAEGAELAGEVWANWNISDGNPTDSHLSELSISSDSLSWTSIAENISGTSVSFNSKLFKDGFYFLKVRAEDSPVPSEIGEKIIQISIANGNTPPAPFSLVSPANGAVLNNEEISFIWNEPSDPDGDAVSYVLYYSTYSNFSHYESAETSLTNYISSVTNMNDYYWKVKAVDFRGMERESSETFIFSVYRGSMTVVRCLPEKGSYGVNMTSVTLYFNNPVDPVSAKAVAVKESQEDVTFTYAITGANNNILALKRDFSY
ncbi:hypothetical protein FP828_09200, partial [bacterium]|nr:hypothetical protein [bacterium]